MKQTPATMALGCGGSLILLGGFVSGFYLGNSQARGESVDSNLAGILKYGPAVIGGLYSVVATSASLSIPENLEELVKNTPSGADSAQVEGCAKGCAPIVGGFAGSIVMGVATYLGYAVGHAMGR